MVKSYVALLREDAVDAEDYRKENPLLLEAAEAFWPRISDAFLEFCHGDLHGHDLNILTELAVLFGMAIDIHVLKDMIARGLTDAAYVCLMTVHDLRKVVHDPEIKATVAAWAVVNAENIDYVEFMDCWLNT